MIPSRCGHSLCHNSDCLPVQCQSAGSTLGLTRTCPAKNDKSCQVSCQDPQTPNQCVVLQTQLVDGSPCGECASVYGIQTATEVGATTGYGGTCSSGSCKSGSAWGAFTVRHPLAFLRHWGANVGPVPGMVYSEPADLDSRDGCGRPIRPHGDSVLFQRYGRYQKFLTLTDSDSGYSGVQAHQQEPIETVICRTRLGSHTR